MQTRLVAPLAASLNSGDCFLLVLPESNLIFAWIGEFANVIENNKTRDVASWIVKTHDMGFPTSSNKEPFLIVMEQGKSSNVPKDHLSVFYETLSTSMDKFKPSRKSTVVLFD